MSILNGNDWARLNRAGYGRTIRVEFELLSIEDMRQAANELGNLARSLLQLAQDTTVTPFERLVSARRYVYYSNRSAPRRRARTRREP